MLPTIRYREKPIIVSSPGLGLIPLLVIAVIGLFRGLLWLAYNIGVKYIGPSRSAILYLLYSFLAVVIQAGLETGSANTQGELER